MDFRFYQHLWPWIIYQRLEQDYMNASRPICFFDSGLGGLSVWQNTAMLLPDEQLLYLADHAHLPYGSRSLEEVRSLSEGVVRFFLDSDAKMVVVACNTASAAALFFLREKFPAIHFVGMEPAVKPAVERTRSGVVGVIATEATFQGELFASLLQRFNKEARIIPQTCPGLVELIEAGFGTGKKAEALLRARLTPLLKNGIDLLVLGCTHYAFSIELIQNIVGRDVTVINPAEAISRRIKQVLDENNLGAANGKAGENIFYTTNDDISAYQQQLKSLSGIESPVCRHLRWENMRLLEA